MKHNPDAVAALSPEYLGFIFWEGSSRFVGTPENLLELREEGPAERNPKLVGVFVDADLEEILETIDRYALDMVQLHGEETPAYCKALQDALERIDSGNDSAHKQTDSTNNTANRGAEIIKAFAVGAEFNFDRLAPYLEYCDYFLFDSRGPLPGGNGTRFNWELLKDYPFEKPFLLSGGLSPESLDDLKGFINSPASEFCIALDVNSGFELRPGEKSTSALRTFLHEIRKTNKPLA